MLKTLDSPILRVYHHTLVGTNTCFLPDKESCSGYFIHSNIVMENDSHEKYLIEITAPQSFNKNTEYTSTLYTVIVNKGCRYVLNDNSLTLEDDLFTLVIGKEVSP